MVTYKSKKQNVQGQYSAMDLLTLPVEPGIYRSITTPFEADVLVFKSQGTSENTLIALFDNSLQGLNHVKKALNNTNKTYYFLGHAEIGVVND